MNKLLVWFYAAIVILFSNISMAHQGEWLQKRILVLHSYEPSYQWTNDIQQGIEKGLENASAEITLSVEYLDAKRVNSPEYLDTFYHYLIAKYDGYQFDGFIVSDDSALQFTQTYFDKRHFNRPVVAVGINDESAHLEGVTSKSKIFHELDNLDETFELIQSLRPNAEKLYYLADYSVTSELIYKRVSELGQSLPFEVIPIRNDSLDDAVEILSNVAPTDVVLLTHFNTETKQNIYHTYKEVAYRLGSKTKAPIFVLWEFYVDAPGVLGGVINHSEELGIQAAVAMAEQLDIPVNAMFEAKPLSGAVLDQHAINRFDIDKNLIPEDARIINKPAPMINVDPRVLAVAGFVIICLTLVVIGQFITIRQRKEIDNKNRKIVSLQKRTLSLQKDIIHVIGEAIETRSGETGNHVKRVAKLSAKLAQLAGLSHREIETIEIISPMHDVGKIAVPEAILDKPGKLTPEEWVIMQQHTTQGFNLLNTNDGDITKLAAIVAHEHHEHWNGNGYPNGIKGEEIHLFSRITAVADVFDALLSERCYKKAWPIAEVIALFEREKGEQFDPVLCQLLLDNMDLFINLRNEYPDA